MTLTFELGLDIFRHESHAKVQVCIHICLTRIVRRTDGHTDTQTDRQTDNAKTITPSADAGCKYGYRDGMCFGHVRECFYYTYKIITLGKPENRQNLMNIPLPMTLRMLWWVTLVVLWIHLKMRKEKNANFWLGPQMREQINAT